MAKAALRRELAQTAVDVQRLEEFLAVPLANGRSVQSREDGFPVLRLTALSGDRVDLSERKHGDWNRDEARPFLVQAGDFMVARGNGSLKLVGRGAIVRDVSEAVAYPDTMIRIRPDLEKMMPEYLATVWNSYLARVQIEKFARTTAGIYKVNQSQLRSIELPVPSLEDQASIINELRSVGAATARLQGEVTRGRIRSNRLRRALLTAAFSGKLTGAASDSDVIEEIAG